MQNLSPIICRQIRDARKREKCSQSELALAVGCNQSALSAFEQGDGTKLNSEVIKKLAERYHISLDAPVATVEAPENTSVIPHLASHEFTRGFCPNPHCPSNHSYMVEDRVLMRPDRSVADPVGGKFCAVCGERLERKCPNCGAIVHDGAICSFCGDSYITI